MTIGNSFKVEKVGELTAIFLVTLQSQNSVGLPILLTGRSFRYGCINANQHLELPSWRAG